MEWNRELEAAIRENPDDEIAWSILEDWTLERGGIRARVIELEKAGKKEETQSATWELETEVLGRDYSFTRSGGGCTWRAGYIVKCSIATTAALREGLLDRLFDLQCAKLMRALRVDIDVRDELASVTRRLAGTPVRELAINAFWKPPTQVATFDPQWLEPTAVERLHLMGRAIAVPYGPALERLKSLWLTPGAPSDLRDLFSHANGLPSLVELAVYLTTLEHRHGVRPELFEPIFDGTAAPALRHLYARDASADLQGALMARAAASRNVTLGFGYR